MKKIIIGTLLAALAAGASIAAPSGQIVLTASASGLTAGSISIKTTQSSLTK
jgi:hypothetical protein